MRRTKPRVVWLPPNDSFTVDTVTQQSGIKVFAVDVKPFPGFSVGEIPLVADEEVDTQAATTSLSDIENSGYRLRRIVGKVWARMGQQANSQIAFGVVTAGIIVRRVDPTTGISLASTNAAGAELTGPSELENYSDPWIWRRSWLLGNNISPNKPASFPVFAESNEDFSALDGPHVDQKTARIIGPEERLFLSVEVRSNKTGGADEDPVLLSTLIVADLRVLASMRTSIGNRRNASR